MASLAKRAGLVLLGLVVTACTTDADLRPFTSDGCSLFPDTSMLNADDWCSCCVSHDLAYWRGGTSEQRELADLQLKECVLAKTDNPVLAATMYEGVRVGGSPYFYNWYRWGYGWSYDRKYGLLTAEEGELADTLVKAYFSSAEPDVCAN